MSRTAEATEAQDTTIRLLDLVEQTLEEENSAYFEQVAEKRAARDEFEADWYRDRSSAKEKAHRS